MPVPRTFTDAILQAFPEDRLTYQKSIATFHPETASETADFFRLANRHKQRLYITGFGNNIDPIDKPFVDMVTIRTDRLNQLRQVVAQDLYIEVGAGYPLREINRVLAEHNLFVPHGDLPYVGSVGGAVAINLSGTLHGHDLPIKKYVIKAEIVTPEGEIITPGSVCFKSVSGYDIVKIFAPSWGLLGLITSVFIRVMPDSARPEYESLRMNAIDHEQFLAGLDPNNPEPDALYARKIKAKFDPSEILPIVRAGR
jgi:FAD/FMN-containing dehydrogenase